MAFGQVLRMLMLIVCMTVGGHTQSIARHIVHIGVDGLRPDCMNDAPGGNPNMMTRIAGEGTSTLTHARTVTETWSGPGWTANLCAMDSYLTGVTDNNWRPPWKGQPQPITPVTGNDKPFPCVYQTIKEQSPNTSTSAWYSWDWLRYLHNDAVAGSVDKEDYCADNHTICDAMFAVDAAAHLRHTLTSASSSYHFIYFHNADTVGHAKGWCTQAYLNAVAAIDSQIGQILNAIDDVNSKEQTMVFLSADHGGDFEGHGFQNDNNVLIPLMVRGPGIKQNYAFTRYVRNLDVAPTALYALGLQPSVLWSGKVMTEAFQSLADPGVCTSRSCDSQSFLKRHN